MNREIKRRLKRDQEAMRTLRPPQPPRKERVGFKQFLREVQLELRRVIWPTWQEVMTYTVVVMVVVTILTGIVFLMDLGFAKGLFELFKPPQPGAGR